MKINFSTFRKYFKHYFLLAVSLLLLGVLIYTIDLRTFIDHFNRLSFPILLCILLVYGLTWWARAHRLHLLVPQNWSTLEALRIQIAGFALNLIYPAKLGDLFMGAFLKKKVEIRYQKALAYILHLRVLDLLVLLLLGGASIFFLPTDRISPEVWLGITVMGGIVSVLGIVILIFNRTSLLDLLASFLPKKLDFTHLFKSLALFHKFDKVYFLSIGVSLLIWIMEVLTCYIISWQIAPDIGFWAVLSALTFGNIMKAIPLFPGGLGTYEAGFILLLTLHGVNYETAVSLSIIDHLLKKMVNLLIGFPVYLGLQKDAQILLPKSLESAS